MKHSGKRKYNGSKPDPKSQLNLGNTVAAFMTDSGEDLYLTMIYNKHKEIGMENQYQIIICCDQLEGTDNRHNRKSYNYLIIRKP